MSKTRAYPYEEPTGAPLKAHFLALISNINLSAKHSSLFFPELPRRKSINNFDTWSSDDRLPKAVPFRIAPKKTHNGQYLLHGQYRKVMVTKTAENFTANLEFTAWENTVNYLRL